MAGYDDDDWEGGVPPEGHHTRDQARPEFWWHQRPAQLGFAGIGVLLVILVIVVLVGCGGSSGGGRSAGGGSAGGGAGGGDRASQSAATILKDAQTALGDVRSYHVSGTTVDKDGRSTIAGDVTASGSLRFSMANKGSTLSLIVADAQTYLKAGRRFWLDGNGKEGPALARLFADRWVKVPADKGGPLQAGVRQMLPKELAFCLAQNLGTLENLGVRTLDGKRVVVIRDKGDKPGTVPSKLYVPASGPALPVRARETGARRSGGKIDKRCDDGDSATTSSDAILSHFNEVKPITAPPDALDLDKLKGAAGSGVPA